MIDDDIVILPGYDILADMDLCPTLRLAMSLPAL